MNEKRFFEETVSSTMVYKGRIVNVHKDRVKSAKGSFSREIVEHPGAVVIVPVIGKSIVMVRQFRYAAKKTMLELPAGTLEKDEDPEDCARRELIEETGYKAGSLRKMLKFYVAPGYDTENIHAYLATNLVKTEQRLEKDEDIEVLEINIDDLTHMIEENKIDDAKTIIGIMFYQHLMNRT